MCYNIKGTMMISPEELFDTINMVQKVDGLTEIN